MAWKVPPHNLSRALVGGVCPPLLLEIIVTDAQMATHHEHKTKDWKGLFLIQQCVDLNIFEKVIE